MKRRFYKEFNYDFEVEVDGVDTELLNQKWNISRRKRDGGDKIYLIRRTKNGGYEYFHRLLMGLTDKTLVVDHIDRNTLNNKRNNLRIITKQQNSQNRSGYGDRLYKGVVKNKSGSYYAVLTVNKIKYTAGTFQTEREAAIAYNLLAETFSRGFTNKNTIYA